MWLLPPIMGLAGSRRQPNGWGRLGKAFRLMIDATPTSIPRVLRIYLWTVLIWISKLLAFALVLRHFLAAEPWQIPARSYGGGTV